MYFESATPSIILALIFVRIFNQRNISGQQEDNKYTLTSGVAGSTAGARLCAQCGKVITERFLLKAMERFWHEDCLKCGCCDCRLGEVGSKLYYKADLMLCKRDYLR